MNRYQADSIAALQDAFAALCGLALVIVNDEGETVVPPSGQTGLSRLLTDIDFPPLQERGRQIQEHLKTVDYGIIYETNLGFKYAVAPIAIGGQAPYYVWASVMVETGSKELILHNLRHTIGGEDIDAWEQALAEQRESNEEERRVLLERISQFAHMAGVYFRQEMSETRGIGQLRSVGELTRADFKSEAWVRSVTEALKLALNLDFAGYAARKLDRLAIVDVIGHDGTIDIAFGKSVTTGEGFFGQVAVTGKTAIWTDVQWDPRVTFLRTCGLEASTLVSFPVFRQGAVAGVLFGGTKSAAPLQPQWQEYGELVAYIAGSARQLVELECGAFEKNMRLSSLLEICQMVVNVKEPSRVLFMLVDICHSLRLGPFTCVVMRDEPASYRLPQVVSREMTQAQIQQYAGDLETRCFQIKAKNSAGTRKGRLAKTPWLEKVWEIPFFNSGELIGVLAIGLNEEARLNVYAEYLVALVVIFETRLQFMEEIRRIEQEGKLWLLYLSMCYWNPEAGKLGEQAHGLAEAMGREAGLPRHEADLLSQAARLVLHDIPFLLDVLPDAALQRLFGGVEQLRRTGALKAEDGTERVMAETLLLIRELLQPKREHAEWVPPVQIRPDTLRMFQSVLERTGRPGEALPPGPEPAQETEEPTADVSAPADEPKPAHKARTETGQVGDGLTPREREVLNLVILGKSNQEIAEKLFISSHTVKNHITKIYEKLGVTDRTQAMAKVYLNRTTLS